MHDINDTLVSIDDRFVYQPGTELCLTSKIDLVLKPSSLTKFL